ncbi:MAG: hypothetical protein HUU20_27550 [Pirellulales bacterium]|nr:hypothetical protein [Pirellulales bacterium]
MRSNPSLKKSAAWHCWICMLACIGCIAPLVVSAGAAELPGVKVTNVRRVFHNGEHNAFTDLIRWQDKFWLTFRSCPDGHMVHPTSSILVLSSDDTRQWKEEHRFSVPNRDTRDPHFLSFQGKLFVYTGTWYSGDGPLPHDQYDLNKHLGFAAWTADGKAWSGPQQLEGTYGHYIWRAAALDGKAYLCGRRNRGHAQVSGERDLVESAMLQSDDGLIWRFRALFQENRGDETAFVFEKDGSLIAVSRCGSQPAQLVKSKPPYTEWTRKDLSDYIGGPLLARWGDRWLAGGRRSTPNGPKTTLYWLADDALHPFAELPSAGDNSYPGFVELSPTRGVVSWYSSHEKDDQGAPITAIHMADLEIVQ